MEQIDQHCFVTLSQTQSGAILYDQRDLGRAQRRFSFGPSSIRVIINFTELLISGFLGFFHKDFPL